MSVYVQARMKVLEKSVAISYLACLCLFIYVSEVSSAVSSCHATLTGSSGTFTSPNYPEVPETLPEKTDSGFNSGQPSVTCEYTIVVPEGRGVQMKFGDFDMGAVDFEDQCDKGEVKIMSGTGKNKSLLDTYCPGNKPSTLTIEGNIASVVFTRPHSFDGTGFLISYIAITPSHPIDDFVTCSQFGDMYKKEGSFSVMCPSGCGGIESHKVYGHLPYRGEKTHLCRAAIHAGVISDNLGGRVNVHADEGVVFLRGSTANNITAISASMSKIKMSFPDADVCRDVIEVDDDSFSASSYVNTTDDNGSVISWLPKQARMTHFSAWAPDPSKKRQWLQVSFKKTMNFTGILTKGSQSTFSYTKAFSIKYSTNNIMWKYYKDEGNHNPKIFSGNINFSGKVRNNFVNPTIVARYIRVYPLLEKQGNIVFCGLKVAFTGCELKEDMYIPVSSTTLKSTTETIPKVNAIEDRTTTSATVTITASTTRPTTFTDKIEKDSKTTGSSSAILTNEKTVVKKTTPGKEANDINGQSILIIAVVAALSVTSILLAALVLFLVRKRKKYPNQQTLVPKTFSETNQTYNPEFKVNSMVYNNNDGDLQRKSKKSGKRNNDSNIDFPNINYRDTMTLSDDRPNSFVNSRAGPSLPHGEQLGRSDSVFHKRSSLPAGASYSTNHNGVGHGPVSNVFYGKSLAAGDEHEYQVIPDPIRRGSDSDQLSASKFSSASSGDDGNREGVGERKFLSSFAPLEPKSQRSGTLPHRIQYSAKDDELEPFLPPKSAGAGKFSNKSNFPDPASNRVPLTSGSQFPAPQHRLSSSSSGSSSKHVDPQTESSDVRDPLIPSSQPSQRGRKASYNVPTNNSPLVAGVPETPQATGFSNEPKFLSTFSNEPLNDVDLGRSNSRSESIRLQNCYDHLYKGKASGHDENNGVVSMTTSDYNRLKLAPAV